jgi:hypothetical protein
VNPYYSFKHPHEPEIPPAYDSDGRCLVCKLTVQVDVLTDVLTKVALVLSDFVVVLEVLDQYPATAEACRLVEKNCLEVLDSIRRQT